MIKSIISHVVILSENNVIATQGKVPWRIPEDMQRFREITMGHPVIMGRKTFDAIGKPLSGRLNIVVSKQPKTIPGVLVANSIEAALELARQSSFDTKEICIIGGGEIFKQTMDITDKLYVTIVHETIPGEVFYPDYSEFTNIVMKQEGESNGVKYSFIDIEK